MNRLIALVLLSNRARGGFSPFLLFLLAVCGVLILTVTSGRAAAPPSFADLVEKLAPSVVNIYTTETVQIPRSPHHDFFFGRENMPEAFRRFFNLPESHPRVPQAPPRELRRTNLGSGVIVSADGYIVTNNHVVANADSINIRLSNFEEYDAEIVGRDPKTDLALLRIKPKNPLPAVKHGDSEKLRVGDWVLAIGNPFGFEQTVTAGIVSGKGRALGDGPYQDFIQTDASINPGNSGGPLFNLKGEMVGINTAIITRGGGNIGIGFAIPVNLASKVIDQLRDYGVVTRGWLGVMIQAVTPELARQFGLERPIGALVGEVPPEGPAAQAGIRPGDVIIAYEGREITQMTMLPSLVSQTPVGQQVKVVIVRQGKKKELEVKIGKLREEGEARVAEARQVEARLGLKVQELSPEVALSLGVKDATGVLISQVEPGSAADRAGLRRGEVIVEINQQAVKSLAEYTRLLKNATEGEKEGALLLVRRQGQSRFVVLNLR